MRRLPAALAALVLYAGIVIGFTWPLGELAATHLPMTAYPCAFDTLYSGWVLAHETHALATDPARFSDGAIFHPAPYTLFYGPTALGALPYFAPLFLASGNPTLALNVTWLGSVALTAWVLHLVVWYWTRSHLGGLAAAAAFLTTGWTLQLFLPTTPHFAVLQYFPLIILLAARPSTAPRRLLALCALVVVQCLTDLVYAAPAVLAPLAVLALARLARRETRAAGLALLGVVALAGLALLVPAWGHLMVRAENPLLDRQAFWNIDAGWLRRNGTVIPWGLFRDLAPTALPPAALSVIGVGLVSYLSGQRRDSEPWRAAGFWAVIGLVMSLTPIVRWQGRPIELPQYVLADWLPVIGHLRVPQRLGVAGLMGLSLLVGIAMAEILRRMPRRRLLRAVVVAAVLAGMYRHYTNGRLLPLYLVYPAIGAESPFLPILRQPGGALLELPAALEDKAHTPHWQARAMYRAIFHQRPLLNGYSSYWPADFAERMQLAASLPARPALDKLRRQTGLALIWVHLGDLAGPARGPWLDLAAAGGRDDLRLIARDGDELLFEVSPVS